ncbi:ParB/RepB/Spo0J family partition protein [Isoptericola sp. NEAU-Y5]|uniref:ParB/RepB/Spo0J family partition protein n=1 Tax=Isoptericola luteus TaxID=2879484 RepID=A0ABS7ZJW0_9MICO|nr:ParB/RepB/Spo0J family partition protein [Isoptericola sp. NEAU-Y5]MCA5894139.1 ParB/RepB/Spo0J family partition protein [Isoptericola sp. NEAU-Y5]
MSQKKRGLGRGLGALIPSGPETERPVDVFFASNDAKASAAAAEGSTSTKAGSEALAPEQSETLDSPGRPGRRSASWDNAIAGGRLGMLAGGESGRGQAATSLLDDITQAGGARLTESAGEIEDETTTSLGLITRITATETDDGDAAVSVPSEPVEEAPADGPGTAGATELDEGDSSASVGESRRGVSRETDLVPVPGARFAEIAVGAIRPNTWQPRAVFDDGELDELVDSISQIGVLQPIVVRPDPETEGQFELIMGERRWRASQAAGMETIPAIVRETEDSDMLRDALLENLHRAALNPLEEAAAYRQLLDDFGCTHEELATRIARSRPQISNTLRLLKLPPLVQRRVAAGVLSAGHARALLGLTDGAEIERLAQRIVSEGLSVRATEEIVTLLTSGDAERATRRAPRAGQRSEAMTELATRLSDRFETRVKVDLGKTKGRVTVEFASVEDLNRILGVMAPEDPGLLRS